MALITRLTEGDVDNKFYAISRIELHLSASRKSRFSGVASHAFLDDTASPDVHAFVDCQLTRASRPANTYHAIVARGLAL
jgi:hypothetical protein